MIINLKKNSNIKDIIQKNTFVPFEKNILSFLDLFSMELLKDKKNLSYPEVIAFAFWIRKSNLIKMLQAVDLKKNEVRLGKGIVLHIPPSNITTGFLYSWVFGLLSGNSNIVKVSSKNFSPLLKIIKIINKLLVKKKFEKLNKSNKFIQYDNNDEINIKLSNFVDARLIWGGDKTVEKFKSYKTNIHNTDLFFFDRFSISLMKLNKETHFKKLAQNFYNDSYIMDQNACSSPHVVIWYKTQEQFIERFWNELEKICNKKYDIDIGNAYQKFDAKIKNFRNIKFFLQNKNNGKHISRIQVSKLQKNIEELRGKFGIFIENKTKNLNFMKIINKRYQTLAINGLDKEIILKNILNNNIQGIDRVVNVGNALSMSVLWDGVDVIRAISRIIDK
jgi:hypothetical protein